VEATGQTPVLANGAVIDVPAITLDAFLVAGNPPPRLVKIDVEGGECEALRGGKNLFLTHRPSVIVEVHRQVAYEWLCEWLREMGYSAEWKIPDEGFPRYLIARPDEA
jgi:Methyltransferase FkbM domain